MSVTNGFSSTYEGELPGGTCGPQLCADDSFVFRSPASGWLLGERLYDVTSSIHGGPPADLAQQVRACLAMRQEAGLAASQEGGARLVGAFPFQGLRGARLYVPEVLHALPLDGAFEARFLERGCVMPRSLGKGVSVPSEGDYCARVEAALHEIAAEAYDKVVLARCLQMTFDAPLSVSAIVRALSAKYPQAFIFSVPGVQSGQAFLGASPELLLRCNNGFVESNPLAGSIPCHRLASEDESRAQRLLSSGKDRREHALVRDMVGDALAPYCRELSVPAEPSLIRTGTLWHLSTRIHGTLRDPEMSSLELAAILHPTPAVCGHPTDAAHDAISRLEGFDRGLYAGMVGWCDRAGNGEWAVGLRCAEVDGQDLRLFAGAGIVAGSDPTSELIETASKLSTILAALGLYGLSEAA